MCAGTGDGVRLCFSQQALTPAHTAVKQIAPVSFAGSASPGNVISNQVQLRQWLPQAGVHCRELAMPHSNQINLCYLPAV